MKSQPKHQLPPLQPQPTQSQKLREVLDAHRARVFHLMSRMSQEVMLRGNRHDESKYSKEEFIPYSAVIDKFEQYPYGSKEREAIYESIRPALDHHFQQNRHHPEHFADKIEGMNLIDLLEMLCDWKSATQNNPDKLGDLETSIAVATKKYNISPQLARILYNTAIDFEML